MQLSFMELWEKSKRFIEHGFAVPASRATAGRIFDKPHIDQKPRSKNSTTSRARTNTTKKQFIAEASNIELKIIWDKVAAEYFPKNAQIQKYSIHWSKRSQKRTLASCNLNHSKVIIARELNYPEFYEHLEPLIYHEMCHAALGLDIPRNRGKRQWHGKDFKALERQHPQMQIFDHWVKSGGWRSCVRSDRGKRAFLNRKQK